MIYKDFKGEKLSALGMGAMRLPIIDGKDKNINEEETFKMVDFALEKGVNYFDTGWDYHGGNSEVVMGKALGRHDRDKYYFADKFPGYNLKNMGKVESIFNRQLEKCNLDYFDFYLVHNVCELNIEQYTDEKYGICDYLTKMKDEGKIKHLGFSAHGGYDVIKRYLEKYGDIMEFCQLQINYLDWSFQDAKKKVELLEEYNIPVWVMEPLRGGRLVKLTDKEKSVLTAMRPDEKIPAWAFRFIQSIDSAIVTLAGASDFEQMKENVETFNVEKPLTDDEMKNLLNLAEGMLNDKTVPCTACNYCTSYCPKELNIPELLGLHNEHAFSGGGFIAPFAVNSMADEKKPSACIGCRACEEVCPQQIKISEALAAFNEELEKAPF